MDAASPAYRVGGRLALSDPSVQRTAQASSSHNYFDELPKLQGEDDWQKWSDALQDAALMAGADAILNGESTHPLSLDDKQCTTAEWNDNIKRTAVWRRRNESLLRAMRNTMDSDADIDMFGPLNAHEAYLGLKSRYYVSDNQKALDLYSGDLLLEEIGLNNSPRTIADDFQAAFDQYNNSFAHHELQRLPENFLKLEFLNSLDTVYADWIKALLKEHDVLGLDQGPTVTFNELVDLSAKRNISQVEDVSQPEPRAVCSLAHHQNGKHNNQTCRTQNPRLRPRKWQASLQDQEYLADHPEIEGHHSRNVCQNPGDYARQEDSQEVGLPGKDTNNGISISSPMDDRDWGQLAASRRAEVDAQRDEVTRAFKGKRSKKARRKHAPALEILTGEWLLYAQDYDPGEGGYHHIRLWETTTVKQSQRQPVTPQYGGRLTVGQRGRFETFEISTFRPYALIIGHALKIDCRLPCGEVYTGKAIFWGNGKMLCTFPAPCLDATTDSRSMIKFAGVLSDDAAESSVQRIVDESRGGGNSDDDGHDESQDGEDSETDDESDQIDDQSEAIDSSAEHDENETATGGADDQEWRQFACARLSDVEAQKIAASDVIKDDPRAVHRGPFPGLWRLYSPRYNPGEGGCHYLKFWETTIQRDSRHRHYRGELSTGPCDDSTVRQIKQFSPSNKVKGSVLELITATENVILGTMTLWGKGKMYATIHSSHLCGYNGGPGWIKFAGIWNEAGEDLPWREVEKLIERKRANNVAASRKDIHQGAGEERYDLVVRAEKNTAVVVKTEDEDTSMAEDEEDEEDETSVIIKTEDADSSSDDSHDEWTDDVATTDRAVRTQEHAVRQGLVSPLHTLSGKWYFHSPDHNPGLDKDISITFYDRQAHDVSERMCAPGHCKSTPAQIHYCGELRFKAPNGERDFHCFIKQFDVPKQTSLIPVIIELWELHNKRAIFVNAWFLGAGTMRMAIPTTYIPSYQGKKTMITFSGVKYGWASPAG
ncbi:hypothetical protein D6D27_05131 [Aureobasidium pullulans]|nr:hypothetical protein D6D27_05131 [Aureobasidium pullulans]